MWIRIFYCHIRIFNYSSQSNSDHIDIKCHVTQLLTPSIDRENGEGEQITQISHLPYHIASHYPCSFPPPPLSVHLETLPQFKLEQPFFIPSIIISLIIVIIFTNANK